MHTVETYLANKWIHALPLGEILFIMFSYFSLNCQSSTCLQRDDERGCRLGSIQGGVDIQATCFSFRIDIKLSFI